jgi:asparagine N-glycosylation enzyme membrane subunit Stt3
LLDSAGTVAKSRSTRKSPSRESREPREPSESREPRESREPGEPRVSRERRGPLAPVSAPAPWLRWLVRWGPIPALLVILGAAFAVRVIPAAPLVFPKKGEVRLFDTDPYYHLRHARYAVAHFPHLQRKDPATYPTGAPAWYVGLFDLTIAGAALVAGAGHPSESTIEHVAAWTPVALGLLAFVAMLWLGWLVAGPAGGLLAALLLLLSPGTFLHRSLVGAVDHHVAEVLLALLTLVGLTRCLQASRATPAPPWWRPAVASALPLALFLFTWYGAPIYIIFVALALFAATIVDLARGEGAAVGHATLRYAMGLLVVLVPVRLLAPGLVMDPSFFNKSLLAIAALGAGIPLFVTVVRRAVARGLNPGVATAAGTLLAIGVLAGAVLAIPHARDLVLGLVSEKSNLVREQREVTFASYWHYGGVVGLIAIAAPVIALVDAARGRQARAGLAAVVAASLVVLLWVRSRDYGYVAGPMAAFLAATVIARLLEVRLLWPRVLTGLGVAAGVVVPVVVGWTQPIMVPTGDLGGLMLLTDGWVSTLAWMRAHTPPLAQPLETPIPSDRPFHHPSGNYGVLAFWDWGHYVADLGERPPLASGGISGSIAQWFFIADEEEAVRGLAKRVGPGDQVRYVIADARTEGDFVLAALRMADYDKAAYMKGFGEAPFRGVKIPLWVYNDRFYASIGSRLYDRNGDGLAHFRLVYVSPEHTALAYISRPDAEGSGHISRHATVIADPNQERLWTQVVRSTKPVDVQNSIVYQAEIEPSVKVFEVVRGAHLVGTAAPGSHVEVLLDLRAAEGRQQVHYHRTGAADASGRFDIVVPYPTQGDPTSDVTAAGPYVVEIDGVGKKRVLVTIADVELGRSVEMP